jgi:cytochrome c
MQPVQAAFDAHGGPIKSVAVSADGESALTASFDYSIILWDLKNETVRAELDGHDAAVNAVIFLPGDRQALSASDDGKVLLWDLENGEVVSRFEGHEGKVVAVAVSSRGEFAASAGWDRTVRVWKLGDRAMSENPEPLHVLPGKDNMNAVGFTDDGKAVVAGASNGEIVVWRLDDGTQIAGIAAHDFAVTALDRHDDGMVATSSVDETVRLWDRELGDALHTLYGHKGPVLSVDLSPDGELVASGGVDGTVRVWRRGDGDRLRVFARHRGPVWSVAFSPDGETLLSGGADGLVLTYDLDDPAAELAQLAEDTAADASVLPDADPQLKRGEKLFKTCSACHTMTPDDGNRAGPTLHGLFGRIAGTHPDYTYSEALEKSDLIWTEETVDQLFAIGPDHLLPGTKMPLQRMPDGQDRADLIAFLKHMTNP